MRTLTLLGAILLTLPVVAADTDFKGLFAKHWLVAKEFTLAVAEAMPAESYGFKPNPDELSFGQLMMHIAAAETPTVARARPGLSPSRGTIEHGVARPDRRTDCRQVSHGLLR